MTATTRTQAPSPDHSTAQDLLATAERVLAANYAKPERLFVSGDGAVLRDATDEEFLDLSSGIAVLALGHRSPVVADAIRRAADGLVHVSNLFHSAPSIELASRLVELSFADKVLFANSGTESVEAAIKVARLAGGEARREIVCFDGAFHGRTLGALAATDRPAYQQPFEPLPAGFVKAPWSSPAALELITERTAAVLLEPIQGEQGVRVAPHEWLQAVRRRCDATGTLLIFDEIQCGLGRTGRLWAHDGAGVTPDMMTLAKPLAGGLPIGALLMSDGVASVLTPGIHGSTFAGGPLVCSVALAVLERISDPLFLAAVQERGRHLGTLLADLRASGLIEEIRGEGLLCGVRVAAPVKQVVKAAFRQRLLVVASAEQVIRLLPPLDITNEQLQLGVQRLATAVSEANTEVA